MSKLSLLLLPALAACTTMAPEPTPAPAPAMVMAPGTFAAGTYTTTVVAADVPADAPADLRNGIVGAWQVMMNGNGQLTVSFNGQPVVTGPYQVSGNEITFGADDTGNYACHSVGRYTWRMSGGQVYYTKVSDDCQGRVIALTSHPWSMQH